MEKVWIILVVGASGLATSPFCDLGDKIFTI